MIPVSTPTPFLETESDPPESGGDPDRQVLIVEDDRDLANLLATWIRTHWGDFVTVHIATTVEEGMERLTGLPTVDIVLLDRRFPEGSGDSLLDTLRSRFDAIVVMITGLEPETGIIRLPVTDYLVKPIDQQTLLTRLSLLEKLETAGVLDAYSDARKASLLEFHLDDPASDPLFRRFAARWSYDRIEVVDSGEAGYVYELYLGAREGEIGIKIVGTVRESLATLTEDGILRPVGELIPSGEGYAWIDINRDSSSDPPEDGFVIYEFSVETPEEFFDSEPVHGTDRIERLLEQTYG